MNDAKNGVPLGATAAHRRPVKVWHMFVAVLVVITLALSMEWGDDETVPRRQEGPIKPIGQVIATATPEAPKPVATPMAPATVNAAPHEAAKTEEAPATPVAQPVAAADAPKEATISQTTYTVRPGDWLSRVFPKTWKHICQMNTLADCDRITSGQVLVVTEGDMSQATAAPVRPRVAPAAQPQAKKQRVARTYQAPRATRTPVAPKTNDAGEILYARVGTAPLKGCGKRDIVTVSEEAWDVLGLSIDDRAHLREHADLVNGPRLGITEAEGRIDMPIGMRLEQVTSCRAGKVIARGPYRTDWASGHEPVKGERFVLPSGTVLVWMRNCFNWVILPEEKTVVVPTPLTAEELPVADSPPPTPVMAESEPESSVPSPVAEASKGFCERMDPHLVLGQEHEPRHDGGDQADSNFLAAAVYCTWRNEDDDGTHGIGAKLTASNWSGTVNQRAGKYSGNMHLIGPAYEYISDDGWDAEVSAPMVGKLHERFSQDKYQSTRDFNLIGLSAGANFYQRRARGEPWFPETQVFGTLAKPLSRAVSHSWDGQSIADTAELSRFGTYANFGARQWLYEDDDSVVLPYAQLGYFLETPSSESLSARLGIADPARIAGIGVGFDHDLKRGGNVFARGWWVDVVKGIRVGRTAHRQHQVITEAAARGITVERNAKGYIDGIRFDDTWQDGPKLKVEQ